jgi:uncharacterized protein YoxC
VAYRAEIEIGVKGAKKLEQTFEQITELSKSIDQINKREIFGVKQVASINEYSRAVEKARANLNKTRIQLDDAGNATKTYKKAIDQFVNALGASNQAQKITNDLIKQEISARTKATAELKAYNAAAAPPRQAGGSLAGRYLRPGSAVSRTQFGAPIGPEAGVQFGSATQFGPVGGPSSSVLGGQSFPIEQRLARLIQAQKEELELKRALQRLDEESLQNLNKKKDLQAELQVILNATVKEAQLSSAGAAFRAEGAGRSSAFVKLQEAENKAKLEAARNTAQLAGEQQAHNRVIKEAELRFEESKAAAREVTRVEEERRAALEASAQAAKNDVKATTNKTKSSRLGSALVGAAFPALFGGGPGAIAGGFIGELFGPLGGVVGSAVGQNLDNLVTGISELGTALSDVNPDIDRLVKAAGLAGTQTGELIKKIEQAEGAQRAQTVAAEQLAVFVGDEGVQAIKDFGDSVTDLGNETSKAFTALSAALAPALEAVANFLAQNIQEQRQLSRVDPGIFGVGAGDLSQNAAVKAVRQDFAKQLIDETEARRRLLDIVQNIEDAEQRIFDTRLQSFRTVKESYSEAAKVFSLSEKELEIARLGLDIKDENVYKLQVANISAEFGVKIQNLLNEAVETEADRRIINLKLLALENEELTALANLENQRNKALSRGSGSTEASRREREAQRLQERIERSTLEREALPELTKFKDLIAAALADQDELTARKIKGEQDIFTIEQNRLKSLIGVTKEQEIQNINLTATAEKIAATRDTERDMTEILRQRNELYTNTIQDLQSQLGIATATTRQEAERLRLEQEMQTLRDSKKFDEPQLQQIETLKKSLIEAQQPLNKFITESTQSLNDLEQVAVTVSQGIGQAVGESMTVGLAGIIDGTKSAQQVFADFLKNIANLLLQTAAQMIATYTAIGIARAFAGIPQAEVKTSSLDFSSAFADTDFTQGIFPQFADGGSPPVGRPSIVGERGPELFVPRTSGTIVPNNQLGGATNIVVNVDAKGSNAQGGDQQGKQLGQAIGAAVQAELIKQKRPGGLLS